MLQKSENESIESPLYSEKSKETETETEKQKQKEKIIPFADFVREHNLKIGKYKKIWFHRFYHSANQIVVIEFDRHLERKTGKIMDLYVKPTSFVDQYDIKDSSGKFYNVFVQIDMGDTIYDYTYKKNKYNISSFFILSPMI
jgi:hypothetical protein